VVPVFNGARYLHACLDSLLKQTWGHCEILVMDDASTDATPDIVRDFGNALSWYRQNANRGQFRNVEDGIARAGGQYVAVYHADDVYDPEIVAQEVDFLETHPEAGLVFCLSRFMDGTGREYGRLELPASLRGRTTLTYADVLNGVLTYKNVFMPTPGAMVRAEVYRTVGSFRPEFGSAADLDMWLRCARISRVGLLERHLFSYRHTSTSEGQSYQLRRTEPENYFAVMDNEIVEHGSVAVLPAARRAFESHRAVDVLRTCVNRYIKGDMTAARAAWRKVSIRTLLSSGRIRRPRHLVLWAALGMFCHLPRFPRLASALDWRYYRRLPWWGTS
jgi:GT2 family glycosyltransferase